MLPLGGSVAESLTGVRRRSDLRVQAVGVGVGVGVGEGGCRPEIPREMFEFVDHHCVSETRDPKRRGHRGVGEYEGGGYKAYLEVDERQRQGNEPNAADCQQDPFLGYLIPVGVRIRDR